MNRTEPSNQTSKSILTLITGTSIAQAIPIAISPILTRIYTPEQFGLFALYISLISIISIIATGRYELAIMIPRKDIDAANITILSISITAYSSLALMISVFFLNGTISRLLGNPEIKTWLYLIPFSVLITGIYQSLYYWCNRKRDYKSIARNRIYQTGTTSSTQLLCGVSGLSAIGLIGGSLIGQLISLISLTTTVWKEDHDTFKKTHRLNKIALAKRFSDFPKFLILSHMLNSAAAQSTIILMNVLFSSASAGFFALTQRVISTPASIIAKSIGDVFRQEASHAYTHNGNCQKVYIKTLKKLFYISTVPFIVFYYTAPTLFEFIFGSHWKISGHYAQILTPMFYLRFNLSPLSTMFMIAEKQKQDLLWQTILFSLIIISFIFGHYFKDLLFSLKAISGSYSVMFIINGLMTWKFSKGKNI
ncbi:oligosaccharide flippase family protein [Lentisphaera profundi]|uniref:Oligosaccharide flippase family protein n=1 Tax=Lentisphaera profundi TaxID=1658616 RepID=A0ABY7VZC8_9BACT|nr:oligosaccharide flippase family protein [Lentisphaera profundi]WDE99154.1 oligosaccharide flippase family protein [Lentisphaera profundi]